MPKNTDTHRGNCLYIIPTIEKKKSLTNPFLTMRSKEVAIRTVVRKAADPRIVAFPIRRRFSNRKSRIG